MMTCGVCCEGYNKTNHKKVCCPFCDFESCRTCTQTYLLSTTEDPHCMSCKKAHNREFVDSFCTKRFRNHEYKKHREQILYERELSRMPETQPQVQRILRRRRLHAMQKDISNLYLRTRRKYQIAVQTGGMYIESYLKMVEFATWAYEQIQQELHELNTTPIDSTDKVVKFTRGCPKEECRGFLDEMWKCGICETSFCDMCNEECVEGHVCDPDTVKTMKLLKRDTKPCPKCSTMIHKIDGCAQMWCTTCQTAFDWRTGAIEKGRIHNPHYFEFKSRTREHGDIPCGGRPTFRELLDNAASSDILALNTAVGTVEYQLAYKYGFMYRDNLNLRIGYLMNQITDDELKKELQRRDKYNDKIGDIRDIYQMFADTGGDLLRQWMIDPSKEQYVLDTAYELAKYTNSVINGIRSRYTCQVPRYIFLGRY